MNFQEFELMAPSIVKTLRELSKAVDDSGLEKTLTELLKIRVSQINGCAFCLQFHITLARKAGLESNKIDLVAVWRDVSIFSDRERAALAWAEALTQMNRVHVPGALQINLQKVFSTQEIAFLTSAIASINAWNRIAGGLGFPPVI